MNYSDKLKDPRWQKKRLEILQRDNFTCRVCKDKENTLHVHHLFYIKNKDPWDYCNNVLLTLCDDCHEKEHAINDEEFAYGFLKIFLGTCNLTKTELIDILLAAKTGDLKNELFECLTKS